MRANLTLGLTLSLLLVAGTATAAKKDKDKDKEMHPQVAWTLYQLEDHSQAMSPLGVDAEKIEEKRYAAESLRQQGTLLESFATTLDALAAAWPAASELDGLFWNDRKKIELSEGAVLPGHRTKMTLKEVQAMLPELKAWALQKSVSVRLMAERLDPMPEEGNEVASATP
jgi:hypothetical protein